tara:strand:+ start:191 stop:556 length:366 start_codon:yes stop_codon:yes gene_type:complete
MTRTPFVMETARSNIYSPDGSTPVAATTDFKAKALTGVDITGDATGSNGDVISYSVAPSPAGSTYAWTVTGGTATIDPVAADTESVAITFSAAATFTVQCVVTLTGDADSPKTITKAVVIS